VGKEPVHGFLFFKRNGRSIVRPDGGKETIPLARGASGTALHGDRVELKRLPPRKSGGKRKGKFGRKEGKPRYAVTKVLERETDEFLGYFRKVGQRKMVQAESSRILTKFKIEGDRIGAKIEDKVLVKFVRWDKASSEPTCRILRVIGPGGEPMTDHLGILAKYGLAEKFPQKASTEANGIPQEISRKNLKNRRDYRKHFTLTIDPLDARDFDDALSIRNLENGKTEIGVHIADVSAYVIPDSHLDKEAKRRGNSTYLVGEVVPMLPEKLSNGICSLVEGEERLVKSVLFQFGKGGKLLRSELAECVIKSDKRLTYEQASLLMKEKDIVKIKSFKTPQSRYSGNPGKPLRSLSDQKVGKLRDTIRKCWTLASKLRKERLRAGSLNLDGAEVKILVNDKGFPERVLTVINDESHQLIEEFMLLANETVAKELRKRKLPGIHRVHPDPDPEKLDELRHFVSLFGISCGDLSINREVQKLLASIKNHPIAQVLRIKFLRSLKQASYKATPEGHYGLAKRDYLHFTSPIRRYSDLVAHRIVAGILKKENKRKIEPGTLESLSKHLSTRERNSVDAERESVKTKLLLLYEMEIKQNKLKSHKAVITDIAHKGFFVELKETLAQGFVPLRTLPRNEGYRVSHDGIRITARNPKKNLRLGQVIQVVIDKVNHSEKQLDFRLA